MTRYVTTHTVAQLADTLSARDLAIVSSVARLRVLTGHQLQRLHFTELHGAHRDRGRRRVLTRLVNQQLLTPLDRRIGGARAGSAGLVFGLGPAGQQLRGLLADNAAAARRVRQPETPTDRFLGHQLAVSELYVLLEELTRQVTGRLASFDTEPGCWWQDSEGQWVKPDAYAVLTSADVRDQWAIEVDRATESLPTLRRKLRSYLALVARGEPGPRDAVFPRVLLTVPDGRREAFVQQLVSELPHPAAALFAVVRHDRAAGFMLETLRE